MPIPTFDVEFTKDGDVFQQAQLTAALAGVRPMSDVLVLSHGWNNDKQDATQLYDELLGNMSSLLDLRNHPSLPEPMKPFVDRLKGRTFAAIRIFWPSKKFTDAELIPGGGAASVQGEADNRAAIDLVLEQLKRDPKTLGDPAVEPARAAAIDRAKALVPSLDRLESQREFVTILRGLLDPSMKEVDDASDGFFSASPELIFSNVMGPVTAPAGPGPGGATSFGNGGGAAGLGDLLHGVQAAARRIANFATYYQMKSRAGTVGAKGVAQMLRQIRQENPNGRIHLAGHSFGGRLVTAAAHSFPAGTKNVTMSLLQAAFSHNGLSDGLATGNRGFFRAILEERRISGPIIITHTKNDKAVGIAYPLASRIAGQNAAALGDKDDPYGGMGRNGAQHTPEAETATTMGNPGTKYTFVPGRVHNIPADVIQNHSDIRRIEVAYAVLTAAGSV